MQDSWDCFGDYMVLIRFGNCLGELHEPKETPMSKLKWIFLTALLVFCLIVIFQNIEPTEVRLLTMSFQLPQAALLLVTLAIGFVMGLLTPAFRKMASWRAKSKKMKSDLPKPEIPERSV